MPERLYWVSDGDGDEWLDDRTEGHDRHRSAAWRTIPLAALAEYLDQTAENCNAHDFCGAHRALAVVLTKAVGAAKARAAFVLLAKVGGLHGMTGVAGAEPGRVKAAEILGIDPAEADHW
jgi:hypothetical protein